MGDVPSDEDPFEGWTLDEEFIGGAPVAEPSALQRAEQGRRGQQRRREAEMHARQWQAKQERARRDATSDARWSSAAPHEHRDPRGGPRKRRRPWLGIVTIVLAVVFLSWNTFVRSDDGGVGLLGHTADAFTFEGVVTDFPTPSDEARDEPIGRPPSAPVGGGTYTFISTQSGSDRPVAYDPCRPIHVVVNNRTMPAGGDVLVEQALDDISEATGLQFVMDGETDEEPYDHRPPVDTERYGDRWAPVLIAWTDSLVTSSLEGETAGVGGSQEISKGSGDAVYVTGSVALDGLQFAQFMRWGRGQAVALGIIRHELGHLVGLDHVEDPDELMYPQASDTTFELGPGDLTGLSLLGQGRCRADL